MSLSLGDHAPDFGLPATDGTFVHRDDVAAGRRAFLVLFICNHCPYVQHVRSELARIGRDYATRDVGIVGIASNDVAQYPEDGPAAMAEEAERAGYTFPYLWDETQDVAKAYGAACTPDPFLFDGHLRLAYRGQIDGSRPRNDEPVTGADLRAALDAVLAGEPVPEPQHPSVGCSIKWKPGNEPAG
jgi:peroxiredoxin